MKCLHIASFGSTSGISRYAEEFFEHVLKPRDFVACSPREIASLELIPKAARIHLEVGVNELETVSLLYKLMNQGFSNVSVTLHDPPFISWPYFRHENKFVSKLSKALMLYLRNFGIGERDLERLRNVYVLSRRGVLATKSRYPRARTSYLPFLAADKINPISGATFQPHMLFFGFIARNKGIEYALRLHQEIVIRHPGCQMYVVGRPIDTEAEHYLSELRTEFQQNVHYLGYVPASEMDGVFSRASITVMPFKSYRSILPASASVMDAMRRGHVVCATPVNAVDEFIQHGVTGLFLSQDVLSDSEMLGDLLATPDHAVEMSQNAARYLTTAHNAKVVGEMFDSLELT